MNKYKICVYAICKNEEKFIDRWVKSMKEADEIYVLDTGSTDKSIKKLKNLGVKVKKEIIKPWRFDEARNKALAMIPHDTDICVCTDLDETFEEGWRKKLEDAWTKDTTRLSYTYNWSLNEENKPIVSFFIDKIHTRNDYVWTHPVHEVLTYNGNNKEIKKYCESIVLNHYPDNKKSRSSYLPLLELSVKEDPNDDRNMHYLGREYMYYEKWNEAIDTLIKHLKLPKATWKDERCASMRFIARSYKNLGRIEESRMWLDKAISEAPYLRDPWIEKGILEYEVENYKDAIYYLENALKIKSHTKTYINEKFSWDETPYDVLSICYFNIKNYTKSLENINKALMLNPKSERIINNKKIVKNVIQ